MTRIDSKIPFNVLRSVCIAAIAAVLAACVQSEDNASNTEARAHTTTSSTSQDGLPVVVITAKRDRVSANHLARRGAAPDAAQVEREM